MVKYYMPSSARDYGEESGQFDKSGNKITWKQTGNFRKLLQGSSALCKTRISLKVVQTRCPHRKNDGPGPANSLQSASRTRVDELK